MTTRRRGRTRSLHRAWTGFCLGLWIAALPSCDRFVSIGTLPPAEDASTEPSDDAAIDAPTTVIDECGPGNTAGLEGALLAAAARGGPLARSDRMLYPYDGTVFPPNLAAPLLMWSGARADAIYLQARAQGLRYQGCLLPSGDNELALPAALWRELVQNVEPGGRPLEIALTTVRGESASGPLRVSITLGADPISGVIYYAAYGSQLAGPINLAAVMRFPLGSTAEPLLAPQGACAGCHAVSANGAAMLASLSGLGNRYDAPAAAARDPGASGSNLWGAEFAAIDPTGTFYLAPAHPALLGPRTRGASPQLTATLFELATGAAILGTGIPEGALTPAFSPDGGWLAFNDAAAAGHALSLVAFSAAQRRASDYRVILEDPDRFPAWPTFLPDAEHVVFALGQSSSFDAEGTLLSALHGPPGPNSDLHIAARDGSHSTQLFRAMGFTSPEAANEASTYLPFGEQDLHQNYHPSVLPRRAGAHDWLFFDSVRNYGNRGVLRGLWCAALDADPRTGDPSHPPFFVPGQEEGAANLRPIAARSDAP